MEKVTEQVATVFINGERLSVWFISDDNYYEVYDANGHCLTEGNLLYEPPTPELLREICENPACN